MPRQVKGDQTYDLVPSTIGRLRLFVAGLGSSLGVGVPPLPDLPTLGAVKEFCTGLQENPSSHPWGEWVGRVLSPTRAFSLAHSLFLFRKAIPALGNVDALSDAYVRRMCTAGPPPEPGFLGFVDEKIEELFPAGWDRHYRVKARGLLLPVKACLEAGRRRGGGRSRNFELPRLRRVALGWERLDAPDTRARVGSVVDGCKNRIITYSSLEQCALKPLHDTIYDHLSTQDWLLRGDATARSFRGFTRRSGEVFVSGDYEAATDNLNQAVYRRCLTRLRELDAQRGGGIPASVWDLAMTRVSSFIYNERMCGVQRRGQLMGSFLSFPILCLVNYLTFKWLVPREVPVKINGDDIVFRASPEEAKVWMDGVGASGLVLSKGKTLVNECFFTLNSTPFRGERNRVRLVPFVRAKALFQTPSTPSQWADQLSSLCVGWNGTRARHWKLSFLRLHKTQAWVSQRSLTRGLGCRLTQGLLRQAGLLRRERFYLSKEVEPPLPTLTSDCMQTRFPQGFATFTRREARVNRTQWRALGLLQPVFHLACRLSAEGSLLPRGEWTRQLQDGTERYWEPRACVRRMFERRWRSLCAPWAEVSHFARKEERRMLPIRPHEKKGMLGVGATQRAVMVDEIW
jgi:hypothetical protein